MSWDYALKHHPDPYNYLKTLFFQGYILKICSSKMTNEELALTLNRLGVPSYDIETPSRPGQGKIKLFLGDFPAKFMVNKVEFPYHENLPTPDIIEHFAKEQKLAKERAFRG